MARMKLSKLKALLQSVEAVKKVDDPEVTFYITNRQAKQAFDEGSFFVDLQFEEAPFEKPKDLIDNKSNLQLPLELICDKQ